MTRERMPTLPDPMAPPHQELDGGVRVLTLTAQQDHDLRMLLAKWASGSIEERMTGAEMRIAHVLGEQLRSNVRTSRLEAWRGDVDRTLTEDREARAQLHEETMKRFDEAVKARRKSRLREVAILIGVITAAITSLATASAIVANAVRGTTPAPVLLEHGGK